MNVSIDPELVRCTGKAIGCTSTAHLPQLEEEVNSYWWIKLILRWTPSEAQTDAFLRQQ